MKKRKYKLRNTEFSLISKNFLWISHRKRPKKTTNRRLKGALNPLKAHVHANSTHHSKSQISPVLSLPVFSNVCEWNWNAMCRFPLKFSALLSLAIAWFSMFVNEQNKNKTHVPFYQWYPYNFWSQCLVNNRLVPQTDASLEFCFTPQQIK